MDLIAHNNIEQRERCNFGRLDKTACRIWSSPLQGIYPDRRTGSFAHRCQIRKQTIRNISCVQNECAMYWLILHDHCLCPLKDSKEGQVDTPDLGIVENVPRDLAMTISTEPASRLSSTIARFRLPRPGLIA